MKYFYIIQRDNHIHEVDYELNKYEAVCEEWKRGGLFFVQSKNNETKKGINSMDVKNILAEDDYMSWIESSKPKLFIKDGIWRDSGERKIVRYEKWKQEEIDERLKLENGSDYNQTPEEYEKARKKFEEIKANLKL